MAQNDTFFTNDTGAASGATDFLKDKFDDITLPATNNTGLTSTASTNPLGDLFANDDSVKFSTKTLYIKDLVLISDRSKWVNNKPTYRVIWNESCPGVNGYIFGNILINSELNQPYVQIRTPADGMGVTGVIRRLMWLVNDDTAASATGQLAVDGVAGSTIDFSALATTSDTTTAIRYSAFVHAAANETKNIHDYRLTAVQANTLKLVGVVVHFENSGANLEMGPGSTYVDKSKVTSTAGASLPLPSYGSSLGGRALVYKTSSSGYALSALSASTVVSIAQGSSGTNLITVGTGHGASFPVGCGIVAGGGASHYVGVVSNVSTDTLTVGPTLLFGLSNAIYRSWLAGPTYAINASLMRLAHSINLSDFNGLSQPIFDPQGRYAIWGTNIGMSLVDSVPAAYFLGASGFMQVEGRFAAAEVEYIGSAIHAATYSVNGAAAWSCNEGQTGPIRKTVFTEAGPGWNSFAVFAGASLGLIGIKSVNLYERNYNIGQTFGQLATFETMQTTAHRNAANATIHSLGNFQRIFADQMYLKGAWTRALASSAAGGVQYIGVSTNAVARIEYYGKDFALLGTAGGGTLTLDGTGIGLTFGFPITVATEGFHTVQYTSGSGATSLIHALDYRRTHGELKSLTAPPKAEALSTSQWNNYRPIGVSAAAGFAAVQSDFFGKRTGDELFSFGQILLGNPITTGATAFIQMPPGIVIDLNKVVRRRANMMGSFVYNGNSDRGVLFCDGETNDKLYVFFSMDTGGFVAGLISTNIFSNDQRICFDFKIPVLGWS